jgi:hypothetical protein
METLDARVRLVEVFRGLLVHNKGCLGEAMLVSLLSACANLDGVEGLAVGMYVHACAVRHGVELMTFLGMALIDIYRKHGELGCCRRAFQIASKEICTWNALLLHCLIMGKRLKQWLSLT